MAARDEDLLRLKAHISERESSLSLRERIKQIFKKYGVTVTAIFLATGITIGAIVESITKALKATGKAIGNGLKDLGARIGSLLPGLIGSIVSFLFKTAGQVIGFLAKHTWLLILAVVVSFLKNTSKSGVNVTAMLRLLLHQQLPQFCLFHAAAFFLKGLPHLWKSAFSLPAWCFAQLCGSDLRDGCLAG